MSLPSSFFLILEITISTPCSSIARMSFSQSSLSTESSASMNITYSPSAISNPSFRALFGPPFSFLRPFTFPFLPAYERMRSQLASVEPSSIRINSYWEYVCFNTLSTHSSKYGSALYTGMIMLMKPFLSILPPIG